MISSPNNLQTELDHLRKVFSEKNSYPKQVTNQIIDDEVEKEHQSNTQRQDENMDAEQDDTEYIYLNLPYGGKNGQNCRTKRSVSVDTLLAGND